MCPVFRACLSSFGNGNEKADSEGSRGLQKTWIVKIILGQFSHIPGALLTRLQKLETWFLQRTRKSHTSVFASFLGVSILFRNASSARKNWLYSSRRSGPTCQNVDTHHHHNSSRAFQQQVISNNIIRPLS
jgi:hypothetical protein